MAFPLLPVMGIAGGLASIFGGGSSGESTSSINLLPPSLLQSQLGGGPPSPLEIQDFQRQWMRSNPAALIMGATASGDSLSSATQRFIQSRTKGGSLQTQYGGLESLVNAGPGLEDVQRSLGATRSLSDMLSAYAQSGGVPTGADIGTGNDLASRLFAPQRQALDTSFYNQSIDANRLSASLGRSINDPILQAKLRTGFVQQQGALEANQGALGTQIAMELPGKRLGYASDNANLLGGLASQAFQNRAAILGLGSNLLSAERGYQISTSPKTEEGNMSRSGGIGGGIMGAIQGLGAGLGLQSAANSAGGWGNLFGFGSSSAGGSVGQDLGGSIGGGAGSWHAPMAFSGARY